MHGTVQVIKELTYLQAAAAETAKVTDGSVDVLINNGAKTGGDHYFTTMND